jgi:hypothetical protein
VPAGKQALGHVGPHPSESDDSELHSVPSGHVRAPRAAGRGM